MATVNITNVSKSFGSVNVLHDFSETFNHREFITLLGPSGCGKTTILRMIAGFEKPTSGSIFIDEREVSSDNVFVPPEKRDIGMVFQSYAVWPHMTVFDNVAYPLKIKKLPKEEILRRVNRVLEIVHMSPYGDRTPDQLSGGQQQRVALGRALVAEPRLLLLDEPLSNLDTKLRESMRYEIKEIQRSLGITVVYVTHDQVEAMTMSDRIVVIHHGVIQQCGTPVEIYRKPASRFVADFVGRVDFLGGTAGGGQVALDVGQFLPYDGPLAGRVVVGVRPENVRLAGAGQLQGQVESTFYLGDLCECRMDLGGEALRITLPGDQYENLVAGQHITLDITDFMVFPED